MMPPLPHHPESHTYTWTQLELDAIRKYGQACADAERERCAKVCTNWAECHIGDIGECDYNNCDMVAVAVDLAEAIRSLE